jgi:hypothetical protein
MFKRLFGRQQAAGRAPAKALVYEELRTVALDELIALLERRMGSPPDMTVNEIQDFSRRLVDITYLDEDVGDSDRARAHELEKVAWISLENALAGSPDALEARRAARGAHIEYGNQMGVRSLAYRLDRMDPGDVLSTVVDLKNAALLADCPREGVESNRGAFVAALLRDRVGHFIAAPWTKDNSDAVSSLKTANAVITAGTLVLDRDPTALWLLSPPEREAIGRYLDDYGRAREALVSMGLLVTVPPIELPAGEISPQAVHDMLLQSATEGELRKDALRSGRYRLSLAIFDQATGEEFMTVIFALRVFIWKRVLSSRYGSAYFERVLAVRPAASWPAVLPMVSSMEDLYLRALSHEGKTAGFHNWLVSAFALPLLDGKPPEWRTDQTVQTCAAVFERELFHFPHTVRFMIRYLTLGDCDELTRAVGEDGLGRHLDAVPGG